MSDLQNKIGKVDDMKSVVIANSAYFEAELDALAMERFDRHCQECCHVVAPPVGVDVEVLQDLLDVVDSSLILPAGKYWVGMIENEDDQPEHYVSMNAEDGDVFHLFAGRGSYIEYGTIVNWMDEEIFSF